MKLIIGVGSHDRFYGKAMRRIWPALNELATDVEALGLTNPGFESFMVGLADDPAADGVEVVFSDKETRQVMVGLGPYSRSETDEALLGRSIAGMIEALRKVDVDDEGDFRKLLSVFEAHQKSRS
jgi:hypothetical protein